MWTTLTIHTDAQDVLTAIETVNGDNVKYVESFPTWSTLFSALGRYFDSYAYIEVKS